MSDDLRAQIYNNLIIKDTEDLLEIWQYGTTAEWSNEVFEILREILMERLGHLPSQPIENQVLQILRKVEEHLEKNELDLALSQCELAIQLNPNSAIAYNYLGEIYDQKGQFELAISNYQMAIHIDNELEEAWENLLSIEPELEEKFERSSAKQHLDQALEYAYNDEIERALEECKIAKSTLPSIAIAYNYLGMILETLSQLESAIAAYLKAIQLNSRFYAARENLANARVWLEEEKYLRAADPSLRELKDTGEVDARFDEILNSKTREDEFPIPGWWYLDADAFLLAGWPGHRTRPGRSGYDPLDRDFEFAHIQGVVIRRLVILRFRTRNPFYLLVMTYLGILYSLPLLGIVVLLLADLEMIPPMIFLIPYGIIGIAFLINVFLSLRLGKSSEEDDKGSTFF
jgi:tetratricopeptide (TPR) repeat protein